MTQQRHIRRGLAALLTLALASALTFGALRVTGFWDEDRAVHIKAKDIETSTLAIGTHLIHLSALTDSLYEIAEQSAENSGQDQIYYKSELGGDAWFNISSASSLADITTAGTPVTDEEIEALYFEYHTKSDKLTYDLRTGQTVNIFDIRSPYELESLDELSPLKMQYDQVRETQGENDVTKRIDEIWETPVSGEDGPAAIRELDEKLSALQAYLNVLTGNDGGAREIEKVTAVMEEVDAARRYEVFVLLEPLLSEYLDELGKGETTSITTGEGDDKRTVDILNTDPELMSAVSESLGNVQEAMITYGGKMLDEGTTVMSKTEYGFSNDLIDHAQADNHAACDTDVANLLLLDNILNDVISDRPRELALLEGTLLPQGTSAYTEALGKGESAEYKAEVAKLSAQALLNRFINENEGEVNTRRGELEFFIEAKCSRIDPQSGITFIDERLALTTESFASSVPQDDFAETSLASVDDHILFLANKRRALELASGGNEMDELAAEKADLQTQRLSALDKNDLAGAKAIEEQINAVEESMRALEAESAARIGEVRERISDLEAQSAAAPDNADLQNQLSAAKAELSNLENSLSDGSLGAMVAQLKQSALDGLDAGTAEGNAAASDAVDALSGLLATDPKLVLPAMQSIYNKLQSTVGSGGSSNNSALIDAIEQAIVDNPNALRDELSAAQLRQISQDYFNSNSAAGSGSITGSSSVAGSGSTTGSGSATGSSSTAGSGSTTGSGSTKLLGTGGLTQQEARDAIAQLAALQLYYDETGSRAAMQLISSITQTQRNLGNLMIFDRVQDAAGEYLPLSAVQTLTGRRYVWNKNASLGVLARGRDYYGFTVYSAQVLRDRDGEKTEKMARSARYLNGVHIPEEYAYEQFGVQAVYLVNTTLGAAVDDTDLARAQELFALFLSA